MKPGYELSCLKGGEVTGVGGGGTTEGDTVTGVGWDGIRGGAVVETSDVRPPHSSGVVSPGAAVCVGSLGVVCALLGTVGGPAGVAGGGPLGVAGGGPLGIAGGCPLGVVRVCLPAVFGDGASGVVIVVVSAGSSCIVELSRGTKELAE